MTSEDEAGDLRWTTAPSGGAEERTGPPRRRGTWLVVVVLLLVVAGLVVGIRAVGPHGRQRAAAPAPTPTVGPPAEPSPAPTASAPAERVVLQAAVDRAGRQAGQVSVSVGAPVTGQVPPLTDFQACTPAAATVEYWPVEVRPAPGLDAVVTVRTASTTSAATGRLGFFFEAASGDAVPCDGGATWPTTDSFEAVDDKSTVTGYLVLDQAVTPATPQGRPDLLGSLQVQLSRFRELDGYGVWQPLTPETPSAGAFCPGSRTAVCASLG